jgi:hypothetical protein
LDTGRWGSLAWLGLVLLSVGLLGVGCSHYEPFEPTPIDAIPDGPGLFTGKTGKWSVVGHGQLFPKSGSAEAEEDAPYQVSPAAHHKADEKKMDCVAMFNKAEGMLSENKNIPVEKKTSLYEMAVKAYNKCKKGEKKEAEDFFKQVFDTSGRM